MQKVWFISDIHFNHKNIIKMTNRPFESIDEMNDTIIENINSTVAKHDILFDLGDFCFGGKDKIIYYKNQIRCQNYNLVMGNHDSYSPKTYIDDMGFYFAFRFPIVIDKFFMLSHEPMFLEHNSPYHNIHGHLHQHKFGEEKFYTNVSVENINYTPISLEEIKKRIKGYYE